MLSFSTGSSIWVATKYSNKSVTKVITAINALDLRVLPSHFGKRCYVRLNLVTHLMPDKQISICCQPCQVGSIGRMRNDGNVMFDVG